MAETEAAVWQACILKACCVEKTHTLPRHGQNVCGIVILLKFADLCNIYDTCSIDSVVCVRACACACVRPACILSLPPLSRLQQYDMCVACALVGLRNGVICSLGVACHCFAAYLPVLRLFFQLWLEVPPGSRQPDQSTRLRILWDATSAKRTVSFILFFFDNETRYLFRQGENKHRRPQHNLK